MTDKFDFDSDEKETIADEVFYDEDKTISEDDFEETGDEQDGRMPLHGKTKIEHTETPDEDDEEFQTDFDIKDDLNEDDFEEDSDDDSDNLDNEDESDDEDADEDESDDEDADEDEPDDEDADGDESDDHDSEDAYESVCFICHRPESMTGKQFKMPNHISVCNDCMQKTMDAVSQFDYGDMFNDPNLLNSLGNMDFGAFQPNQSIQEAKQEKEDEEKPKKDGKQGIPGGIPNIRFVNLADLQGEGGIPNRQKLKKKRKDNKPLINLKDVPPPHKIKASLDEYVVGQEKAKKVISVAVYNHYKRVATNTMNEIEIEKSNMLMIGPTGCGKTYLVKTLARILDVPLAIADATSLTEAGYIGDDIESVLSKLLAAAGNDVEKAEMGIVFIDEIDKIAKKQNTNSRDVSGESVQQGMLKLLEGADIEVPVGANSKNAMVPLTTINTRNILFICGGAFPDLDEIIKQRLSKQSGIGFNAVLKDEFDKDTNIHSKVTVEDLKKYGMIPEFLGRLPIVFTVDGMTEDMLVSILSEPKNAILKQYQKLLELDEVKLDFDESALRAIAKKALEKDTGARALRAIIEEFMLDIMYEIPKDENIGQVTITGDYIEGKGGPVIDIRG